jgi:hypothetical protein
VPYVSSIFPPPGGPLSSIECKEPPKLLHSPRVHFSRFIQIPFCSQNPEIYIHHSGVRQHSSPCYIPRSEQNIQLILTTRSMTSSPLQPRSLYSITLTNSVALVRERNIPTERPPLVGEVGANFCEYCSKTELRGLSPRANYSDRTTADFRESYCQLLRIEGVSPGKRRGYLRPYSRFPRLEPLLFLSSSPSIVLTKLSEPHSRPTPRKIW